MLPRIIRKKMKAGYRDVRDREKSVKDGN